MDDFFRVRRLAATPNPQQLVWQALHQDYSENYVAYEIPPSEQLAGEIAVRHLLANKRGHYGPLEHPQISYATGWFPHDVMQQARTHRIGVSFDVQSGRYTGKRICELSEDKRQVEEVFYFRPPGNYTDRQGHSYVYGDKERERDLQHAVACSHLYRQKIEEGMAEEQARSVIPGYALRQHFVVSFTLRSLWHFLQIRSKADAQLEIQQLCELIYPDAQAWTPELTEWFRENLWKKGLLAP